MQKIMAMITITKKRRRIYRREHRPMEVMTISLDVNLNEPCSNENKRIYTTDDNEVIAIVFLSDIVFYPYEIAIGSFLGYSIASIFIFCKCDPKMIWFPSYRYLDCIPVKSFIRKDNKNQAESWKTSYTQQPLHWKMPPATPAACPTLP